MLAPPMGVPMRIINDWQYRYVERSLYGYYHLKNSSLTTERLMIVAIESAREYFQDSQHELMMVHFYFDAAIHRRTLTNAGHFRKVCTEYLHTEEPNGYVIRREIVYRVAMNCYSLGLFKLQ